jgi:hypothetical protein
VGKAVVNSPVAAKTVRQVEAWAGEVRVNLVRVVALLGFYGYHLVDVYLSRDDPSYTAEYRASVAAVAVGWAGVIAITYAVLRQGRLPPTLPYLTVAADAALAAALVIVSGGPRSPLVQLFLLVVAAAPLRLSLPVVYASTAAALIGYLVTLGHYVFVWVGTTAYYADATLRISRPQQVVTVLAILTAGLLAGQIVRQSYRLIAASGREDVR